MCKILDMVFLVFSFLRFGFFPFGGSDTLPHFRNIIPFSFSPIREIYVKSFFWSIAGKPYFKPFQAIRKNLFISFLYHFISCFYVLSICCSWLVAYVSRVLPCANLLYFCWWIYQFLYVCKSAETPMNQGVQPIRLLMIFVFSVCQESALFQYSSAFRGFCLWYFSIVFHRVKHFLKKFLCLEMPYLWAFQGFG